MMIYCQHCGAQVAHDARLCGCGGKPQIGNVHLVLGWSFVVLLLGYLAANGDFWSPIFIAGVVAAGVCILGQIVHIKRLRGQIVDKQPNPSTWPEGTKRAWGPFWLAGTACSLSPLHAATHASKGALALGLQEWVNLERVQFAQEFHQVL